MSGSILLLPCVKPSYPLMAYMLLITKPLCIESSPAVNPDRKHCPNDEYQPLRREEWFPVTGGAGMVKLDIAGRFRIK